MASHTCVNFSLLTVLRIRWFWSYCVPPERKKRKMIKGNVPMWRSCSKTVYYTTRAARVSKVWNHVPRGRHTGGKAQNCLRGLRLHPLGVMSQSPIRGRQQLHTDVLPPQAPFPTQVLKASSWSLLRSVKLGGTGKKLEMGKEQRWWQIFSGGIVDLRWQWKKAGRLSSGMVIGTNFASTTVVVLGQRGGWSDSPKYSGQSSIPTSGNRQAVVHKNSQHLICWVPLNCKSNTVSIRSLSPTRYFRFFSVKNSLMASTFNGEVSWTKERVMCCFFSLVWRKHPFRYFSAQASVPIVIAPRTLSELKSAHLNAG